MALTLELPPDLEARLRQEAEARGLDASAYATELLSEWLRPDDQVRSEEQFRAFASAIAEGSDRLPPLSSESFTRESFYADRD